MAGIDHGTAPLAAREAYSITQARAAEVLRAMRASPGITGSALILTCNRTEAWISYEDGYSPDALALFIACLGEGAQAGLHLFHTLEGRAAAEHIFEVAAGMQSMIFGETQILTQVKAAIALAREAGTAGPVLESLFNKAIEGAKKVASSVKLTKADASAAESLIATMAEYMPIASSRCLVIGNGEMGRLAAGRLAEEGALVRMTLRKYKKGESIIPSGCVPVDYGSRIEEIADADVVISATASPHYTVHAADIAAIPGMDGAGGARRLFFDLAMPRDLEPAIADLAGAVLYDIDSLSGRDGLVDESAVEAARAILAEEEQEFASWYAFREHVPLVREIARLAADDVLARTAGAVRRKVGAENEKQIEEDIHTAVEKVVGKLMFGFKDNLDSGYWGDCLDSMKKTMVH